jgi:anti-sigma regulatory factor (Ser/Thr protein kinase)
MAPLAAGARQAAADINPPPSGRVLGRLTIAGRPEHVGTARSFVADALSGHPVSDVMVLLTSEIVTNAVLHSDSRRPGGTVTITVLEAANGVRVEVADAGSQLSVPAVKGDSCVTGGHGLVLVQRLADEWGYAHGDPGITVWFRIGPGQQLGLR